MYGYDAKNRLTSVTPKVPTGSKYTYTYDERNRRATKTHWAGYDAALSVYTSSQTVQFLYDGLALAGELDAPTGKLIRSYTWDPMRVWECGRHTGHDDL